MSEQDGFDAAVKRMDVHEHLELYVRPGLGSRGLLLAAHTREGAVRVTDWRSLREAARATDHVQFNAANLDGLMVGEAFLKHVIGDPKVQATGAWLCLERPVFREVFSEGKFPDRVLMQVKQRRPRRTDLPTRANVGYPEMKDHWNRRRPPPDQSMHFPNLFAERAPVVRNWDHKWPLVLDVTELTGAFSAEYDSNATYQHDPTEGPIHHAANALADRSKAFFELIGSGQLTASGTSAKTHALVQISGDQWSRSDKWLDVKNNDVFHKDSGTYTAWWSGVRLRLGQATHARIQVAPSVRTTSSRLRRRRTPVAEAVAECLAGKGLERDRGDMSFDALADAIAPCMRLRLQKPYKTAADMGALGKAVSRYFGKLRK